MINLILKIPRDCLSCMALETLQNRSDEIKKKLRVRLV